MKRSLTAFLLSLSAATAGGAGCDARSLSRTDGRRRDGSIGGFGGADGGAFVPARKVDMLVVVDDSSETRLMQDNLVRNFPTFMNRLMDPPRAPRPPHRGDQHRHGRGRRIDRRVRRDRRQERHLPVPAARHLHRRPDSRRAQPSSPTTATNRNYTGNLADVFGCIAALGESGCGFEHQLAAITRALGADGQPPPAENQGFLRPDAFLFDRRC